MTDFLKLQQAEGGKLPEWIRLLPLGEVKLSDGREGFTVDPAVVDRLVAAFRSRGIDLVIDYEHQSLMGEKAPAAGWIKNLEARADGLWGRVEWTSQATEFLKNREYRYFSPVLRLDPADRTPLALLHVGLTNVPAINHLPPLVAKAEELYLRNFSAAERKQGAKEGWAMPDGSFPIKTRDDLLNAIQSFGRAQDQEAAKQHIIARAKDLQATELLPADWPGSTKKTGGTPMKNKLLGLLALKAEATDEEMFTALEARLQLAGALPEFAQVLGLKAEEANPAAIKGAILALKQGQEQLATLQTEVAALKTANAQGQAKQAVDEALAARKITPAQAEWALKYAAEDPEGFAAYVKAAAPVLVTEALKIKTKDGKGVVELTGDELQVCKATGVAPEAFKAEKTRLADGQAQ